MSVRSLPRPLRSRLLRSIVGASIAVVAGAVAASPESPALPKHDVQEALMHAMNSQDGRYRGELRGDFAALVRQKLNTTSPVFVDVSTIGAFRQKGCRRLQADITAPEVTWTDPKTKAKEFLSLRYQMNLCPDGSPPLEATGLLSVAPK